MRSKLFVPGSRPELFTKALGSAADGISLDLEDSVVPERKAQARDAVRALLQSGAAIASGKTMIVRVNAIDTPYFAADVAAIVQPGLHVLNLPKPESPDAVRAASDAIAEAERANGVTTPVRLLLNIESPKALRTAAALAVADSRVAGLQLGLGDLFEPTGISRRELAAIQQAMFMVCMAAGEAGVYAYDSAFADIQDTDGLRAEAALARNMGFVGKSCIHPSQVAIANEVFQPTQEEIAHAVRVLAATEKADVRGIGAFVVDGKMVDVPFVNRARAILATARRLRLLPA